MASTLTWLDFSEHDRRQAERIIALFEDKGTVDQLGIGAIRDAFADLLFPGTSVIQSRARYFLFIPWTYLGLERKGWSSAEIGARASKEERRLITTLLECGEAEGVIGRVAGEKLKLLPSSIYWQGLGRWNIRHFPGSQRQYYRSIDRFYKQTRGLVRTDDGDVASGSGTRNWAHVPEPPSDFPERAGLSLTRTEAVYLRERIRFSARDSMLAFLVNSGKATDATGAPWMHPQLGELTPGIRHVLEHARVFSEVMLGAALLYNLMLAHAKGASDHHDDYRERFAAWVATLAVRADVLSAWDESAFWAVVASTPARVTPATRLFVQRWFQLARRPSESLADQADAQRLIRDRERALKGGLARFDNQRALDLWRGASGVDQLAYRWPVVQDIVRDIQLGLNA